MFITEMGTSLKKNDSKILNSLEEFSIDSDVDIIDFDEKKVDTLKLGMQSTSYIISQEIEDEKEDENHADHVSQLFID